MRHQHLDPPPDCRPVRIVLIQPHWFPVRLYTLCDHPERAENWRWYGTFTRHGKGYRLGVVIMRYASGKPRWQARRLQVKPNCWQSCLAVAEMLEALRRADSQSVA